MSDLFNTGIRPAISDYLKKKSEEERDYGSYWSASSAGYCMRLNIMRRLGVPKVPELEEDDDRRTRVFEAGHLFHEWIQRITKDAGLSIASEVELQDEELMIRGHFDDLCLVDDKLILYDYKTAHSASFNYKKNQDIGHYHKMQLGTYMYMLRRGSYGVEPNEYTTGFNEGHRTGKPNFFGYPQLEEARILSISKDDLRMDEKQLLWTPNLEKEVYSYWSTLNGYWKNLHRESVSWLNDNITKIGAPQWIEYVKLISVANQEKQSHKEHRIAGGGQPTRKDSVISTTDMQLLIKKEELVNMSTKQDTPELYQRMAVHISPSTVSSWSKSLEEHLKKANLYTTLTETGVTTTQIILSFGLLGYDMVNELAKLNAQTAVSLTSSISKKLPACTCLKFDGGFMGKRSAKGKIYNDYYYNDEPCSLEWYEKCKKEGLINENNK